MQITFLIGGLGNQLFQYATSSQTAKFSMLFQSSLFSKLMKWKKHENIKIYQKANIFYQFFGLLILIIDAIIFTFTRTTILTELDTRKTGHVKPAIYPLTRLGYFQNLPEKRDLEPISMQFQRINKKSDHEIVLHIRGGDILQTEAVGSTKYGILDANYYATAIRAIGEDFSGSICIITDDINFAKRTFESTGLLNRVNIVNTGLLKTLEIALNANYFISSSSTLSYWIVRLRANPRNVVPRPFQLDRDYKFLIPPISIPR